MDERRETERVVREDRWTESGPGEEGAPGTASGPPAGGEAPAARHTPAGHTETHEVREVREERPRPPARARWSVVAASVVDYLFFLLYALLGLRFLLSAMGAREDAGFVQLVRSLTAPFYAPFEGIVAAPGSEGATLELPILVALLGYAVLHMAIRGLLKVVGQQTA